MLARILVFAGLAVAVAIQVPPFFEKAPEQGSAATAAPQPVSASPATTAMLPHGSMRLAANPQGHFTGDFKINGKPVQGLIDTGATYVSVNETTAHRLGFASADLDYRYSTHTANGIGKAALVTLDRIELGSIKVRDVPAMVMKDDALSSTLIGVSFLKKLSSYGVEDGSLHLVE